jgi:hypothetical protein
MTCTLYPEPCTLFRLWEKIKAFNLAAARLFLTFVTQFSLLIDLYLTTTISLP